MNFAAAFPAPGSATCSPLPLALTIPDFLGMFGRSMHENTHSSLLAWLLDPRTAPTIGPATLTALVAGLEEREIDYEAKSGGPLSSQYVIGRCDLRFKRGMKFTAVAEIKFGVEFDELLAAFAWQVTLIPEARFHRIDDGLWKLWRESVGQVQLPGAVHQTKANTVRFVQRPLDTDVTAELAFSDVKQVLDAVLSADAVLADAVGLAPEEG